MEFCNHLGYYLRVEVTRVNNEILSSLIDKEAKFNMLSNLFNQIAYPLIKEEVPNVITLRNEIIYLDNGEPALFVVVGLPDYAKIGKFFKKSSYSYQGILLTFADDEFLVEIRRQDMFSLGMECSDDEKSSIKKRLLRDILRETKSLTCTKN